MAASADAIYWNETLRLWREVPLRCRYGHDYLEIHNLGQWRCSQHAAPYSQKERRWPCCGRSEYERGCVPADHNVHDRNFNDSHSFPVPLDNVMKQLPSGPGVDRERKYIHRYDRAAHDRLYPYVSNGYMLKPDVGAIRKKTQLAAEKARRIALIKNIEESQRLARIREQQRLEEAQHLLNLLYEITGLQDFQELIDESKTATKAGPIIEKLQRLAGKEKSDTEYDLEVVHGMIFGEAQSLITEITAFGEAEERFKDDLQALKDSVESNDPGKLIEIADDIRNSVVEEQAELEIKRTIFADDEEKLEAYVKENTKLEDEYMRLVEVIERETAQIVNGDVNSVRTFVDLLDQAQMLLGLPEKDLDKAKRLLKEAQTAINLPGVQKVYTVVRAAREVLGLDSFKERWQEEKETLFDKMRKVLDVEKELNKDRWPALEESIRDIAKLKAKLENNAEFLKRYQQRIDQISGLATRATDLADRYADLRDLRKKIDDLETIITDAGKI
jgi:hypothetical protein